VHARAQKPSKATSRDASPERRRPDGPRRTEPHWAALQPRAHDDLALQQGGEALPLSTRAFFEHRFGTDFSDVRVHTGGTASAAARDFDAHGFSVGQHVYLGAGPRELSTVASGRLLTHELAHVAQRRGRDELPPGVTAPDAPDEREAHRAAHAIEHGASRVHVAAAPTAAVARQVATPTPPPAGTPPSQSSGPPVVFGLDITSATSPTIYFSVLAPGRSMADIATYLYGSAASAGALAAANGVEGDFVPAGRSLRPAPGLEITQATCDAINSALERGAVLRSRGLLAESQGPPVVYRVNANGQTFDLTDAQLDALVQGVAVWIQRKARTFANQAHEAIGIEMDFERDTNSVVRGVSDWWGNANRPSHSRWTPLQTRAQQLVDRQWNPTRASVGPDAQTLVTLARDVASADLAWRQYINATISGAESITTALEITRDVSFGVAAGIAGAVVAPIALGAGVAALGTAGITGTAATVIATGGSLVVAGGAGALTHGGLELTTATGGELLATAVTPHAHFDAGYVWQRTLQGLRSGFEEGVLGGAGQLAGTGLGLRLGAAFAASRPGRAVIGGTVGAGTGLVASTIDVIAHPERGPAWSRILLGTGIGLGTGVLMSQLPITGLFRTGGRLPVFTGRPTMPAAMLNSPWGLAQECGPAMSAYLARGGPRPPLPADYAYIDLGGGRFGIMRPMTLQPLAIYNFGPTNFVVRDPAGGGPLGSMLFSYAQTRPVGATNTAPNPGSPFSAADYTDTAATPPRTYQGGHGVDHADTFTGPGAPNSSTDPANFSPQEQQYNERFRNPLVRNIRGRGNNYAEVTTYPATSTGTVTRGEPVSQGRWLIEISPAGTPVDSWYFPTNTTTRNTAIPFQTQLATFRQPVANIPPSVLGAATVRAPLVGGVTAGVASGTQR
jgi:Domain of unknown function (DUF4157)